MAIDWTDATENAQADDDAARAALVGIHTGDPGPAGTANEATGGSPAYARKPLGFEPGGDEGPLGVTQPATVGIAWGSATVDLPPGTYTWFSLWDALGTFTGKGLIPVDDGIEFASQGTLAVSVPVGPNAPA